MELETSKPVAGIGGDKLLRKDVSAGTFVCIGFVIMIAAYFSSVMGLGVMFSVIMKTAHDLLLNTCLYIMGVAVLAGAVSSVFSEFGVTALLNKVLSPLMKPLFGLPGASALGAVTCYFSDNPAIVLIAKDPGYAKYFKKYQWATMINFGTTFGMGIIITGGILGIQSGKYATSVVVGIVCAIIGGIVSTRLLMLKTKKLYGAEALVTDDYLDAKTEATPPGFRKIREGSLFQRGLNATFDGGKTGVELGLSIIPGILIFTTLVMMLTNGPSVVDGVSMYQGVAYEGTGLLPFLGEKISFILTPLFGFANPEVLGLPLTSLGACGASIAGAKALADQGMLNGHDMAVYFAIAYCWAGFLSTHASMADSMKTRSIVTFAMLTHFIGGIVAGLVANYAYMLIF
jgi:spore maturation protein SpmA